MERTMREKLIDQTVWKNRTKPEKKPLWKQVCFVLCVGVFLIAISSFLSLPALNKKDSILDSVIEENRVIKEQQAMEENDQIAQSEVTKPENETKKDSKLIPYITKSWIKNSNPILGYATIADLQEDNTQHWIAKWIAQSFPITMYAIENQETKLTMMAESTKEETARIQEEAVYGDIGRIYGDYYMEELETENQVAKEETNQEKLVIQNQLLVEQLKKKRTMEYLVQNFFIVDTTTVVTEDIFNVDKLLEKDFTMKKEKKPQILIYHTHGASEAFSDSRQGVIEDSIIGVGMYLAEILQKEYGYEVIHDTTPYDFIQGKIDRNKSYNMALSSIEKTLKENPSIEVIIDLHRDSGASKRVTTINGKATAQIMLFNGLSRNLNGPISYLSNPNLQSNIAFSLQMKLASMERYPDFAKKIYLKGYRYNLHLREKSLLIELGTVKNTIEEAKNAMEPLADVLDSVLSEK